MLNWDVEREKQQQFNMKTTLEPFYCALKLWIEYEAAAAATYLNAKLHKIERMNLL